MYTLLFGSLLIACNSKQLDPDKQRNRPLGNKDAQTNTVAGAGQAANSAEQKEEKEEKEEAKPELPSLTQEGKPFLTINDQKITEPVIDALLSNLSEEERKEIKEARLEDIKDQMITIEVLYQAAVSSGLHKEEEVKTAMIMAQRQVLATTQLQRAVESKVTEEFLKDAYNARLTEFQDNQVDVAIILVEDEAKLEIEAEAVITR